MFNIEDLKSSGYFKEKILEKGELLFDEGKINNNLYYIVSGKLSIEKYTMEKKELKELAIINPGVFLGEGSLNKVNAKNIRCIVLEKSKVLYINAVKDFSSFMKSNIELSKNILVSIISSGNKRITEANKYITSIYEINKSINEISSINYLEIFKILEKINLILNGDYILYLEANPINEKYLILKYDSRKHLKMQDVLVEKGHYKLEEIGIHKNDKIITKKIFIANETLGSIVIGKTTEFSENEKRIFLSMTNSLSGLLKQKKILEEEINKKFNN